VQDCANAFSESRRWLDGYSTIAISQDNED
jgi:hypothetical protein